VVDCGPEKRQQGENNGHDLLLILSIRLIIRAATMETEAASHARRAAMEISRPAGRFLAAHHVRKLPNLRPYYRRPDIFLAAPTLIFPTIRNSN
jgi:hypothetical protein